MKNRAKSKAKSFLLGLISDAFMLVGIAVLLFLLYKVTFWIVGLVIGWFLSVLAIVAVCTVFGLLIYAVSQLIWQEPKKDPAKI